LPRPPEISAGTTAPADRAGEESEVPAFLNELIERRAAIRTADFSPVPASGQILAVARIRGVDSGRSPAVLLDKMTPAKDVWSGWLVAAETDYAGAWDMLLEPEDGPFDPSAGMVQAWNPVSVYLPSPAPVLAELKPVRLQAVRAMAEEYAAGNASANRPEPGRVAPRYTLHGFSVLTGTPLGGEDDPRHSFQSLYRSAADNLQQAPPVSLWAGLTRRISAFKKGWFFPAPLRPLGAAAVILMLIILLPPLFSSSPLDRAYESIAGLDIPAIQDLASAERSPDSLGFSGSSSPPPALQAFRQGWENGKQNLLQTHPAAAAKGVQSNTEWAGYYELGRWALLLEIVSQALADAEYKAPEPFWHEQKKILRTLQADFETRRQAGDEYAAWVLFSLKEIDSLLQKFPAQKVQASVLNEELKSMREGLF
ncbi:MAG: hypothetical protein GY862_23360, partial [Gammaproteobacteria bacterium]|nr:hypothetical protein [Gammaproteobacteria bacterium]